MLQRYDDVFAALHREHRERVFSFIHRRVSSREAAEELTNDVFRIAWQRNPDPAEVTPAWLLTVARNVIGNEYRRMERAEHLMRRAQSSGMSPDQFAQAVVEGGQVPMLVGEVRVIGGAYVVACGTMPFKF